MTNYYISIEHSLLFRCSYCSCISCCITRGFSL